MKEALSVIASTWSCAFIILFALWVCTFTSVMKPGQEGACLATFVFLGVPAITGIGWLLYRSDVLHKRRIDAICNDDSEGAA